MQRDGLFLYLFKKNINMMKKIIFSTLIFTAIDVNAQQPTQKIVVAKGQRITIVDSMTMNIVQEAMGQIMEIPGNTTSSTMLEIKETSDNKTIIASTLKKTSFNMSMMGQEMNYDSEKPSDKETEAGKALEEKLNKTEDITLDNMGKSLPSATPVVKKETEEQNGGSVDMIKNLTGMTSGNSAENAFMLLSSGSKVGSSWADSTVNEGIKTMRTYIIKSMTTNEAVITVMGVISGSRKIEMQGMEMNMNAGGKVDGEIIVDITNGLVKKRTTIIEPNNSIEVMGMSIPVTGKVSTVSYYTTVQ